MMEMSADLIITSAAAVSARNAPARNTPTRDTSGRYDVPRRVDDPSGQAPADTGEFGLALMTLLRVPGTSGVSSSLGAGRQQNASSPSQMFEAASGNSHENRLATLKADDRWQRLQVDGRLQVDRGSVQTRLAASVDGQADQSGSAGRETRSAADLQPGSLRDAASTSALRDAISKSLPAEPASGSARAQSSQHGRPDGAAKDASLEPHRTQGAGATWQVPAGELSGIRGVKTSASEAIKGYESGEKTVAHQLAKVLATGRHSGMESDRLAAGSQAAITARDRSAPSKSADATLLRDAKSTDRAEGGGDRGVEAGRSTFDRLMRAIRLQSGPGFSSAKFHLDPPDLGRVQIDVRLTGHELEVTVRTETTEARDVLEERTTALREALARQGINIQSMDVVVNTAGEGAKRLPKPDDAEESTRSRRAKAELAKKAQESHVSVDGAAEKTFTESTAGAEARLDIRV